MNGRLTLSACHTRPAGSAACIASAGAAVLALSSALLCSGVDQRQLEQRMQQLAARSVSTLQQANGAGPAHGHVDAHIHLTTHMVYQKTWHDDSPLSPLPAEVLSHEHGRRQVLYEPLLAGHSASLLVMTALDDLFDGDRDAYISSLLDQFAYIRLFVARFADRYALALTPAAARQELAAGKRVFVLGIEGGGSLISSAEDARFWAGQGVSLLTPVHLEDNEYGDGWMLGGMRNLINWNGFWSTLVFARNGGLTDRGRLMMKQLADAGIIIDLSHMSTTTLKQALAHNRKVQAAVIASHANVQTVTGQSTGLDDGSIIEIYRQGGLVALTSGGIHNVTNKAMLYEGYCAGSVDDFRLQSAYLQGLLKKNGHSVIGFATDFNGFVGHFRPRYGEKGCSMQKASGGSLSRFDRHGLTSPADLAGFWQNLSADGHNNAPYNRSAEAFLQLWERALKRAGR